MIDIENAIFTKVANELKAQYPDIYVTGEYVRTPPSFPCVSIEEKSNIPLTVTRTSSSNENHVALMYEVNIYSNKQAGRKTECKAVAQIADEAFERMGFTRSMLSPTPNLDDATIYRITGRYQAVADAKQVIYRR